MPKYNEAKISKTKDGTLVVEIPREEDLTFVFSGSDIKKIKRDIKQMSEIEALESLLVFQKAISNNVDCGIFELLSDIVGDEYRKNKALRVVVAELIKVHLMGVWRGGIP